VGEYGVKIGGHYGRKSNPKIHELTAFLLDKIVAKEKIKYSSEEIGPRIQTILEGYISTGARSKNTLSSILWDKRRTSASILCTRGYCLRRIQAIH